MKLSKPQITVMANIANGANPNQENRVVVRALIVKGLIERLDKNGEVLTTGHSWSSLRLTNT